MKGDEVTAETCAEEIVRVGSLVTYYVDGVKQVGRIEKRLHHPKTPLYYGSKFLGAIQEQVTLYSFDGHPQLSYDSLQDLVTIHVGIVLEF